MSLSVCKKEAKRCLKTRKLRAFRISLILAAVSVLSGFASFYLPQWTSGITHERYLLFAAQTVLFLLSFGLMGSVRQGRTAWLYCSACGKEPSGVQFRYWLRKGRGFRAAMLHTAVVFCKAIRTMLLCAPGCALLTASAFFFDDQSRWARTAAWIGGSVSLAIGLFCSLVINQKYALAPLLFTRSAHKGIRPTIRGSCSLMDGSCLRLLILKLSFLPWAVPCLAVLPLVYVLPYYQQATACMLRDILRAHTI